MERRNRTVQENIAAIKNGQNPRSQLIPGAEQHIVMEEEITEITQPSTVPVASKELQSFPEASSSPADVIRST